MRVKVYTIDIGFPRWLKRSLLFVGAAAIVLLGVAAVVRAGVPASFPIALTQFADGQTLSAADLNAKLGTLQDAVNTLNNSITTQQSTINTLNTLVPAGAVMAFNLDTCPAGWIEYSDAANRVVIAAGDQFSIRSKGGSKSITLNTANLPPHSHLLSSVLGSSTVGCGSPHLFNTGIQWGTCYDDGQYTQANNPEGSMVASPINSMPPYVVLRMCVKL